MSTTQRTVYANQQRILRRREPFGAAPPSRVVVRQQPIVRAAPNRAAVQRQQQQRRAIVTHHEAPRHVPGPPPRPAARPEQRTYAIHRVEDPNARLRVRGANPTRRLVNTDTHAPRRRNFSISNLDAALERYGLHRVPVAGDGNCQFRSMAAFFEDADHLSMRRLVCQFIRSNDLTFKNDIATTEYRTMERYLAVMSRPGTWGDGITLQAFGLLFQVDVVLFMPTGTTQLHPQYERHVAFVRQGDHYEPALPPM